MIEVYKFGGASVKDADGVKNLAKIVGEHRSGLVIVISAMGKITNALEDLWKAYISNEFGKAQQLLSEVHAYHDAIASELFGDPEHPVFDQINNAFVEIEWIIEEEPQDDEDYLYDQIVSIGEIVSTTIVSAYLNEIGVQNLWTDARGVIQTDNNYREGKIDWTRTKAAIEPLKQKLETTIIVTQGFLGGTSENFTTTLGREGSDYSAAILASCLGASQVTIWKDVPGVLNADPKFFEDTRKYEELSYQEAIEMTYYGACVIHPKTIKPLRDTGIPLLVKPFMAPAESGTTIGNTTAEIPSEPAIIIKKNQTLVSIASNDYSFITEDHLSEIFSAFAVLHIKINMMQVSALSFSACFDHDVRKFEKLLLRLNTSFRTRYNRDLELITIRHYKRPMLAELSAGKTILLEQFSRNTAQMVIR